MATKKKGHVFRVSGLPGSQPDDELKLALETVINDELSDEERSQIGITTALMPSCYRDEERVALVEFHGQVPEFLSELIRDPLGEWQVEMGDEDISFDQHFFGFTQLYKPKPETPITAEYVKFIDGITYSRYLRANLLCPSIVAITGLDGHAYGSWRGRGNLGRMWLRDFLPRDLPSCRTMTYGYNSKLSSHGINKITDYGRELIEELKKIRNTEEVKQ